MKVFCIKTYKDAPFIKGKEYNLVEPYPQYKNDSKTSDIWIMADDENQTRWRFWTTNTKSSHVREFKTYFIDMKEYRKRKLNKINETRNIF